MSKVIRGLAFALSIFIGANVNAAANDTESAKIVAESITVGGAVQHVLTLSVDDLRQFPPQQLTEVTLTRQSGANVGKLENVKGVRLRDILEKATLVTHDHNDVKKMIIVATATDGYKVVFSWSELFNSPIGDGVLVYFEKEGKPLADDEGHIAMISSKDIHTGPRHVKWLKGIEVRQIAE